MKAIIWDTETTGLVGNPLLPLSAQPHIIEFYGCLIDDERGPEPLDELEFICKPPVRLEAIITEITGLTDNDLRNSPPFKDFIPAVRAFFAKGSASVAHNLSFDFAMVTNEFVRAGEDPLLWPKINCCTVANTEHLKGHRLKLMDLHVHLFGEGFPKAHRARFDVAALTRCWLELRKRGEL